jgi:hypothetical protein
MLRWSLSLSRRRRRRRGSEYRIILDSPKHRMDLVTADDEGVLKLSVVVR